MSRNCSLIATALLLVMTGCEQKPTTSMYPLELRALTSSGTPVAGARFWGRGQPLGVTDTHGTLLVNVKGGEGERFTLSLTCPESHRGDDETRQLALQHVQPVNGEKARIELRMACEPRSRLAALIVKTHTKKGLRLPIYVDGEVLGHTDDRGVAHLLLKPEPGASVRAMVDTSAYPGLRPNNPVRVFHPTEDESVLLFEQTFSEARGKRKVRKRPKAAVLTRKPYRIN